MANAGKKHIGSGAHGKSDGSGSMTELPEGVLEENMVLSNRDKSRHSGERGLDSRQVQTDQYRDHVGARRNFEEQARQQAEQQGEGNTSGLSGPMSDTSGDLSSLKSQSGDE